MATIDTRLTGHSFSKSANSALISQSPGIFDLLVSDVAGDTTYLGYWAEIAVFDADFPANSTSILLEGDGGSVGVNLSSLNGKLSQGYRIPGHFSSITIPSGSTMQIIAFRF